MRWYHSIITKISLIFLFAVLGVFTISFAFANYQTKKDLENAEKFAIFAIQSSYDTTNRVLDFKKLQKSGLCVVKDQQIKKKLLSRRHFFRGHRKQISMMQKMMGIYIKPFVFGKHIYITIKRKKGRVVLFKTPFEREAFSPLLVSVFSILLIVMLYVVTIKNIIPLYALKKKIKQFADGDYEIDCSSKNRDEIGVLSNEFNEAVKKIKSLRDSRQLFLRNIMHELKTPITKGKFAVEITKDKNLKSALQNIFNRQEYLIEELARIEKLNANELQLDIKEYLLEDIVDFAEDILNHNQDQVIKNINLLKLRVDFELFGTAIKNLLDNGIKYSDDSKVNISNDDKKITISNRGEKLEFPLQNYAQPYFLKGTKQKSSRGLGFGLYIVWHILKLHNMKIEYRREEGINIFEILLK